MKDNLLGIYLREIRKEAGLSLKEAVLQIGLQNIREITEWESGKQLPPLDLADKIAKTYAISEEEIRDILQLEHLPVVREL